MNSIQTTEVFDDWFSGLKDKQAVRRIQVRIDRTRMETSAIVNRLAKAFPRCEFIMGQATAYISCSAE